MIICLQILTAFKSSTTDKTVDLLPLGKEKPKIQKTLLD